MTCFVSVRAYRRAREPAVDLLIDYAGLSEITACTVANEFMADQGAFIMGQEADP